MGLEVEAETRATFFPTGRMEPFLFGLVFVLSKPFCPLDSFSLMGCIVSCIASLTVSQRAWSSGALEGGPEPPLVGHGGDGMNSESLH